MRVIRICAAVALIGAAGVAIAGDGMSIRVLNDSPDNLIVTLVDRSVQPPQTVLSGEVINGNASISASIGTDASGHGRLSWTATTVDRDMRRCGSRVKRSVEEGATIHVSANHRCPSQ